MSLPDPLDDGLESGIFGNLEVDLQDAVTTDGGRCWRQWSGIGKFGSKVECLCGHRS